MNKNHLLRIRVTKDFKEELKRISEIEKYPTISDFVRDTIIKRVNGKDRIERLLWILDKDERANNPSMAGKIR